MNWRLARSLIQLRDEVDERWPGRSKISDGTLGDAAHAARLSDHNPNAFGVVRAMDVTVTRPGVNGIDGPWYAEHICRLGLAGHVALANHGYVIWNRRTAGDSNGWTWKPYDGINPHTHHVHVSVGRGPQEYDSTVDWRIAEPEEDFMAGLTENEQHELLTRTRATSLLVDSVNQRCERLEATLHGVDDPTKATSVAVRVLYLWSEILNGDNAPRLRRILAKYGGSP